MVTGNGDTFLYLFLLSLVNRVLKTSYILPLCFNSASKYNIKNKLDWSFCKHFFFSLRHKAYVDSSVSRGSCVGDC